jgi:hypothetical protein
MSSIQEVFLETDWDDARSAQRQRDQRMQELQAQGLICTSENLYNINGQRVFILVATPPIKERLSRGELVANREERPARSEGSQRPARPVPKFETR